MKLLEEFLVALDKAWRLEDSQRLPLKIIGSAALLLQVDYDRGTKDSDVLETVDITAPIKEKLLSLAGKGSDLSRTFRLYLDVVAAGIPFLPPSAKFHPMATLNQQIKSFEIEALDVTDVVVSKLKRFSANDVSDISAMVRGGWVSHARFLDKFRKAVDAFSMDARAEDLPKYIRNFQTVERDFFNANPSQIDLPEWI